VVPRAFAPTIQSLARALSRQECKPIYGFSLLLLVWTNGMIRILAGLRQCLEVMRCGREDVGAR